MADEARIERTNYGLTPRSEGWFIVNAAKAEWYGNDKFGRVCAFQGERRCPGPGVNIHVLQPGKPACLYHEESEPEAFLVLSGECLLLVENEERKLTAWDYFHCPPGTRHVFVGAGDGPCAIVMIGRRALDWSVLYPENDLAWDHGASAVKDTPEPREAYGGSPEWKKVKARWPLK